MYTVYNGENYLNFIYLLKFFQICIFFFYFRMLPGEGQKEAFEMPSLKALEKSKQMIKK